MQDLLNHSYIYMFPLSKKGLGLYECHWQPSVLQDELQELRLSRGPMSVICQIFVFDHFEFPNTFPRHVHVLWRDVWSIWHLFIEMLWNLFVLKDDSAHCNYLWDFYRWNNGSLPCQLKFQIRVWGENLARLMGGPCLEEELCFSSGILKAWHTTLQNSIICTPAGWDLSCPWNYKHHNC